MSDDTTEDFKKITHVGIDGEDELFPVKTVILHVKSSTISFFVDGDNSEPVWVKVVDVGTDSYIRTEGDETTDNNLLSLPRC
jgi:hypothetical protein